MMIYLLGFKTMHNECC